MQAGRQRGFLLELAAEGLVPLIPGAAVALRRENVRAIDHFGKTIVESWLHWMQNQPRQVQINVIAELADLPSDRARQRAESFLNQHSFENDDYYLARDYLRTLPRSAQRFLVPDPFTGGMTLTPDQSPEDEQLLLCLLPLDAPPYLADRTFHDLSWQPGEVITTIGHGPTYRASAKSDPSQAFTLELCMDPRFCAQFHAQESRVRELFALTHQASWSHYILRMEELVTIDSLPGLISEHQPGGDLTRLLSTMRQQTSRGFTTDEVLQLVIQILEGLALIHASGHIYGCLQPSNIRINGEELRLAHFGLGEVEQMYARERLSSEQSLADVVLAMAGCDQRLYLSPELIEEGNSDPSDDLYALGVLWAQLLLGDVTRPLSEQYLEELQEAEAPRDHLDIIQACLQPRAKRPAQAKELLTLLQHSGASHHRAPSRESSILTADDIRELREQQEKLLERSRELLHAHQFLVAARQSIQKASRRIFLLAFFATVAITVILLLVPHGSPLAWLLTVLPALIVLFMHGVHRSQMGKAQELVLAQIAQLVSDYPDKVQEWGGASMLHHVDLVRELVGALETDAGAVLVP